MVTQPAGHHSLRQHWIAALSEPFSVVEEEPKPPANQTYRRDDRRPKKRKDPHVDAAAHEDQSDYKRNGHKQQSNMRPKLLSPPHAAHDTTLPEKRQSLGINHRPDPSALVRRDCGR